jgi:hypothetical protein
VHGRPPTGPMLARRALCLQDGVSVLFGNYGGRMLPVLLGHGRAAYGWFRGLARRFPRL